MIEKLEKQFTKYEIARILGARSLQLAMDAPVLLKLSKEEEEELNYDSLKIAEKELESGVLPISVKRPLPKKSEKTIKKLSEEEIKQKLAEESEKEIKATKVSEKKEESEDELEDETGESVVKKSSSAEDEFMELATPTDEVESESEGEEEI